MKSTTNTNSRHITLVLSCIFIMIMLILTAQVHAADWKHYATDSQGCNYYHDISNDEDYAEYIVVWLLCDVTNDDLVYNYYKIDTIIEAKALDKKHKRLQILSQTMYSNGQEIDSKSYAFDISNYKLIKPGTVNDALWNNVINHYATKTKPTKKNTNPKNNKKKK